MELEAWYQFLSTGGMMGCGILTLKRKFFFLINHWFVMVWDGSGYVVIYCNNGNANNLYHNITCTSCWWSIEKKMYSTIIWMVISDNWQNSIARTIDQDTRLFAANLGKCLVSHGGFMFDYVIPNIGGKQNFSDMIHDAWLLAKVKTTSSFQSCPWRWAAIFECPIKLLLITSEYNSKSCVFAGRKGCREFDIEREK